MHLQSHDINSLPFYNLMLCFLFKMQHRPQEWSRSAQSAVSERLFVQLKPDQTETKQRA